METIAPVATTGPVNGAPPQEAIQVSQSSVAQLEAAYSAPAIEQSMLPASHPDGVEPAANTAEPSQIPNSDLRLPENLTIANATQEKATRTQRLKQRLGGTALRSFGIRAATEVVGLGVDAALMGAGSAGVIGMQSVGARELTATVPEITFLDKVLPREHNEHSLVSQSRARKIGFLALGVGLAIVSQKAGSEFIAHTAANLNHGAIHFAAPLATKVGAMSAYNAAKNRLPAKKTT